MDGVVVFADNKVLDIDSFENKLFNKLREESSFTILPVCSIYDLESTIKATSTFKNCSGVLSGIFAPPNSSSSISSFLKFQSKIIALNVDVAFI